MSINTESPLPIEQPSNPLLAEAAKALEEYRAAIYDNTRSLQLEFESARVNEAIHHAELSDDPAIRSQAKKLRAAWRELTVLALLTNVGSLLFQLQLPHEQRAEELRGQPLIEILIVVRSRLVAASRDIRDEGVGSGFADTLAARERELHIVTLPLLTV